MTSLQDAGFNLDLVDEYEGALIDVPGGAERMQLSNIGVMPTDDGVRPWRE